MDSKLCYDCDEEIPAARLKAKPGAIRCVSCQGKFESKEEPAAPPRSAYHFTRLGASISAHGHQEMFMRKMATRGFFATAL